MQDGIDQVYGKIGDTAGGQRSFHFTTLPQPLTSYKLTFALADSFQKQLEPTCLSKK